MLIINFLPSKTINIPKGDLFVWSQNRRWRRKCKTGISSPPLAAQLSNRQLREATTNCANIMPKPQSEGKTLNYIVQSASTA